NVPARVGVQPVLAAFGKLDPEAAARVDQRPAVPAVVVDLPFLEQYQAGERLTALGPNNARDHRRRVRAGRECLRHQPEGKGDGEHGVDHATLLGAGSARRVRTVRWPEWGAG